MGRGFLLFLLLFGVSHAYNAKNVDSQSVIYLKNDQSGNFFGHSVAIASESNVYVGAPLDQTHGNVFKCSIDGSDYGTQEVECHRTTVQGMTEKSNQNLFGMTVSALNGKVVSCAPFEPITDGYLFGKEKFPMFTKIGKCYEMTANSNRFQSIFEFNTPFEISVCTKWNWKWECVARKYRKEAKIDKKYENKWGCISLMGPEHIQTEKGVVFSAPWARNKKFDFDFEKKRITGTIVLRKKNTRRTSKTSPFSLASLARGKWYENFPSKEQRTKDPHNMDLTGESLAQGKFFSFNLDKEHFVVGAPNANNLQGRAYICHDCFGTNYYKNGRTLIPLRPQSGERFGHAVAAVDINGDGYDEVVVGAPLHVKKVFFILTAKINFSKVFILLP